MFRRLDSLRARLMIAFMAASLVPLVIAAAVTIPWYRDSIRSEAQRALSTNASVAGGLLAERTAGVATQMRTIASSYADESRRSPEALAADLDRQAELLELDYVMWVNPNGVISAATTGHMGHSTTWEQLLTATRSSEATGFAAIIPVPELVGLDLDERFHLRVEQTSGGSAQNSEAAGALAIVGVAPVTDSAGRALGSVVGVQMLKFDNEFVDSIADKVGGVATLFQNGVRVATTVRTDSGERAVGTAISDQVRAAVLESGQPYRGTAFVVNKQYLTAYDPIHGPDGEVIGMLFVGVDEEPYQESVFAFMMAMLGLTGLGVVLAGGFAYVSSAALHAPIKDMSEAAARIAAGDLTVQVQRRRGSYREANALGDAFNKMTSQLSRFIGKVSTTAGSLDAVSTEIAEASAVEADAATSQASAVAEATATIEELDRSFASVADGARRVLGIAEDSLEVAEQGRGTVEANAATLERVADGAASVRQAAGTLTEVADDIGQVTFVIGSIAEQTKILALNAAIEAARAGSAGKGFAVVAKEIRTLADSVSSSVIRIEELVRNIQDSSRALAKTASQQAEVGQQSVEDGMRTRESFDAIYERMDRTASAAREIASAAAQQQSAARQIVEVMHQVSEAVSGTAAASRQLAESARDVKKESSSLSDGLRGYKVR